MNEKILSRVNPRWHAHFLRFIDSGELDPGFEEYLNSDTRAQEALDEAFQEQAGSLGTLLKEASKTDLRPQPGLATKEAKVGAAAALLSSSAKMDEVEQRKFFEDVGSVLKTQITSSQREQLAQNLRRAVPS